MINSLVALIREIALQIKQAMARAQAEKADRAMHALSEHLLKDIGIARHAIDN